jgi:acetyltransferase-like isoleucine patch superfamily enzyme
VSETVTAGLPRFHAQIDPSALVGYGTRIWELSQVRENADIGKNCVIGRGVYIDHGVVIGDNCKIQNGVNIYYPAVIAAGVFIGPGAMLINDPFPRAINPDGSLKKVGSDWTPIGVTVREGASIGTRAVIFPGVEIGEWAMVGAGALVRNDVRARMKVYGVPAVEVGSVCVCGRSPQDIHEECDCGE